MPGLYLSKHVEFQNFILTLGLFPSTLVAVSCYKATDRLTDIKVFQASQYYVPLEPTSFMLWLVINIKKNLDFFGGPHVSLSLHELCSEPTWNRDHPQRWTRKHLLIET